MLEKLEYNVSAVQLGSTSRLSNGTLVISESDLSEAAMDSDFVESVAIDLVLPGDSVRISGIVDVVEPRSKLNNDQVTFPGVASKVSSCGSGTTISLRGVTVTTVGQVPPMSETFVQEDCLVDMAGTSADFSPFSRLVNIVVNAKLTPTAPEEVYIGEMRDVGIRVSRYLASLAVGQQAASSVVYQEPPKHQLKSTGRVVYVCSLISEGMFHDTLLYGATTENLLPRWLPVTHMVDGALVSSDLHYPNQRTPTYLYQSNPVVEAVRTNPSTELAGVILTLRYGSHEAKKEAARKIVNMAREAGADSVIVHPAVGGNAHVDAVNIAEEAERAGLSAVLILQEMAGARGNDLGLVHSVPEANALVSTGNRDEVITLQPLERVVGPHVLNDGSRLDQEIEISLRSFLCSTSQVGAHRMTAVAG